MSSESDASQLGRGQPDQAATGPVRPGLFQRAWMALRSLLGGGRSPRPFDFRSYEFPRLDIDRTAERLRLIELAEENGRRGIPATDDEAFDAPQERIVQFIRGEVATISASYEASLMGLNNRIADLDVPASLRALAAVPADLARGLDTLAQQTMRGMSAAREAYETARRTYEAFRSRHGLEREPRYPASKFNYVATLIAIAVLEGLVNALFFARGSDYGLLGGALYALLLAAIDILVVFNFGRAIAWIVAREWYYRTAAWLTLLAFLTWALGFNLLVGHVREALQVAPDTAMTIARDTFVTSPLGLSQADSWVLVAIGLVLSILAMVDGLRWDDPYPGYGDAHRKLVLTREDLEHWKSAWREGAIAQRDHHLGRIEALLRDVRRDVVALERTLQTKTLLLQNVRGFSAHYEESCNALIRLYRDHNIGFREEPPPPYFSRTWKLRLSERLSDSTDSDRERLREARTAVGQADSAAAKSRKGVQQTYSEFVQQISSEAS